MELTPLRQEFHTANTLYTDWCAIYGYERDTFQQGNISQEFVHAIDDVYDDGKFPAMRALAYGEIQTWS